MAQNSNTTSNGSEISDMPKENLRILLDTIEGINQTNEFKSVLTESMEAVRLVLNSEASSLMLMDKDSGELYLSMPTGPAKKEIVGKRLPKNRGIAGWVAENKRPYLTNDVSASEYFYGDLTEDFTTRSLICVPLINRKNEVVGVIQALNRRNNADFTPHDIPVFQALASHITIAIERTRQINLLHDHLKHKDAVIVEIHHRIKNNLQAMLTMVQNEISEVENEDARQLLEKVTLRIQSMSELHDLLSDKNLNNTIEMSDYLMQLSAKIEETMQSILYNIKLRLKCEKIHLKQEKALLCGLILNELLINIYKHAFRDDDEEGEIEIEFSSENENKMFLKVSDNGVEMPESVGEEEKNSIGMWLVNELLKKLEGTLEIAGGKGQRFTVTFPAK